jgi:hypothetical protein
MENIAWMQESYAAIFTNEMQLVYNNDDGR